MATSGTAAFDLDLTGASWESELWVPVFGYEGLYEVSSFGRVRSVPRVVEGRFGPTKRAGVLLKIHAANGRYLKVSLCADGKMKQLQVHRLVLLSFIGEPPSEFVCDHIDCDITNNRLENLRWLSSADNARRRNTTKLTAAVVSDMRANKNAGVTELAEKHGVSERHVYNVLSGNRWKDAP